MEVYTVFPPNSFPISRNPTISKPTLKIMVIVEIGRGIKFATMIERPETLPTARLLGMRKKNTPAAVIIVAIVIMINSCIIDFVIFIY